MSEMRKSLLANKGASFQKLYEQCLIKIQKIKQKNDFMQKQIGEEIEDSIADELRRQRQFLQKEIEEIKELIDEIESRFKDPQSKTKLKNIKVEAQKQIQRNKVIMKDFITKSFMNKSRGSADHEDQSKYVEGGTLHLDRLQPTQNGKQSILTEENIQHEKQVQIDFEIQRKIEEEKKNLLNEVEESSHRVNEILNDMAMMVDEQGENLNHISEEMLEAKKNVQATNSYLNEAGKSQKKSRKKYIILAILIILIVAAVIGVVFILKK